MMKLQEQTRKTLQETGLPISVFCRKIGISQTAFYRWLKEDLRLSEQKENNIRKHINKLGEVF